MSLVLTGRKRGPAWTRRRHQIRPRCSLGGRSRPSPPTSRAGPGVSALLDRVGDRPIEGAGQQRRVRQLRPICRGRPGPGDRRIGGRRRCRGRPRPGVPARNARPGAAAGIPQRRGSTDRVSQARARTQGGCTGPKQGIRAVVQPGPCGPRARARPGVAVHRAVSRPHPHGVSSTRWGRRCRPPRAIYRRLADPRTRHQGRAGRAWTRAGPWSIPGMRNKVIATGGRFMPHEWLTRVSGRLPPPGQPRPSARRSKFTTRSWLPPRPKTRVGSADRRRRLAVRGYRALPVGPGSSQPASFRWKGTPRSRCAAPWWPVNGPGFFSPSSRTPAGLATPEATRFTLRPAARRAWAPSSSAMKPRPGRLPRPGPGRPGPAAARDHPGVAGRSGPRGPSHRGPVARGAGGRW